MSRTKVLLLLLGIPAPASLSAFAFFSRRLPPRASQAGGGAGGLFRSRKDGKTGFTDETGRVVIPPQSDLSVPDYAKRLMFTEGMAAVAAGDKRGYIDKTGLHVYQGRI